MPAPRSIAVLGGGLTGLSAAWHLHRLGHQVTVLERAPAVGGNIATVRRDGWLIEGGPNSLQRTPDIAALLGALGLGARELVAAPAAKQRFIVRRGRPQPLPAGPGGLFSTRLFSWRARLGILGELFTRPRIRTSDIPLAEFVRSHFGQEMVDYALNPFVAGVYAGDPEKLSTRHAFPLLWRLERERGSVLRGLRAEARATRARGEATGVPAIISFPDGLRELPDALARALPPGAVRTGATATTVIPGRPWKVIWSEADSVQSAAFDAVLLALPAPALAGLAFGTLGERPLALLDNVPHPPVSSLFLGYRREQVAHPLDGFGALVPAAERRQVLGILFSSTLFPGRAPEGHVALTVFAGGMRQPETARLETAALLARVAPDLRELLGVSGEPAFVHHTFWPRAIPQYNLGHERFVDAIARCENDHPGLFIGGNARDGISLPDCMKSGARLARAAADLAAKL
ncbi:MAG TPA: protoporphyrinogen oxidase [Opitutaceae bacterium]|nr:protoporphyrinogen oxidase [Opitutaceae bacterium]